MAAELEEKLTCSICLVLYHDPVTLSCGHNFCKCCIQDWWRGQEKQCPECREPFPEGAELRRNVTLSGVLELVRAAPSQAPGPLSASESGARCPRHGWPLELFCRTEGRGVCSACTVHECRNHERALPDTERRERETQLRARLEVMEQQAARAESQLQELQRCSGQIKRSACTMSSMVSNKFSRLLQALEMQQALTLQGIQAAETRALAQAQGEEQRLQDQLDALAQDSRRIRDLLGEGDSQAFLQASQQLPEPPPPPGPLTLPQWDEAQQLGALQASLHPLCDLLLPAKATDPGPVDATDALVPVPSMVCPLRKKLWQNYRNLTFDPNSANRYLYLSRQDQRVKHRRQPRDPAGQGSFELWQVQCVQSFQSGHHYWEVHASDHSVTLGVAYQELERLKRGPQTDNIGRGASSWGLCVQEDNIQAWHDGKVCRLPGTSARLLGMDLNLASGSLTFYSLQPETRLLHTFHAFFTQPLYPVFWLFEGRTLTLCQQPGAEPPPEPS